MRLIRTCVPIGRAAPAWPCATPLMLTIAAAPVHTRPFHTPQETERMVAIVTECRKLGATVEEFRDYCVITPPTVRGRKRWRVGQEMC
eukprot:356630-Chlamydomonas_euryale.AAC.10